MKLAASEFAQFNDVAFLARNSRGAVVFVDARKPVIWWETGRAKR
jgi:hypothetical protein